MIFRNIGNSGISASIVALGTWGISGWKWGGADAGESIRAIRESVDRGVNLIDTAPIYGMGLAEELVGKAVKGVRDSVIIATKCGLLWDEAAIGEEKDRTIRLSLRPESIRREVEESLARLCTDYIDLYQTHWQDNEVPIAETMGALEDLKKEGKIRAIGVCNASQGQLSEYLRAGGVASDQERYSMLDRGIEADRLPRCAEHGLAVLAYSPLAQGLLTGAVGPDTVFTGDDQRIGDPRFSAENRALIARMLSKLSVIAADNNLALTQLVIAWTAAQPGITHVLCGARTAREARENAAAGKYG